MMDRDRPGADKVFKNVQLQAILSGQYNIYK